MASLVTDQGIVHYETYGRGRPVLLLHGWLGSWALWRDTIEVLGKDFKTYSLDFWGFGSSSPTDDSFSFSVPNFVELVNQFMDRLGIRKAPLIGHSMGGTVSLGMATRYPERVVKVGVVGSPIDGKSLNLLLKASGYQAVARTFFISPPAVKLFLRGYAYFMANDGARMSQMITEDFSQVTMNSFFESIGTLRETDLRPRLSEISIPTLGIYGRKDIIVNPNQHGVLQRGVSHAETHMFQNSGHFPMLDEPDQFHKTVQAFLHNGS
ncbi:MAG: alpha/beta hydrolase [Anaerolineae bacterium]|nr:alpha/beta hydrolase [Anaerolineae bacterium]